MPGFELARNREQNVFELYNNIRQKRLARTCKHEFEDEEH